MPARYIPPAVPTPPQSSSIYHPRTINSFSDSTPAVAVHDFKMPGHESQWIFPIEAMSDTLSVRSGLTLVDERVRRAKGINFITQVAMMLKLPQMTISTASIYFHRFYMRCSIRAERADGVHHYTIAAGAIFLASKAEENCRKTKDIIICVTKVAAKDPKLIVDEQSKEFWKWRDIMLTTEEMMLETLTFDIHVDTPYRILPQVFEMFGLFEDRKLRDLAWAFLNDAGHTHLCVIQLPKDIAIAALFFALINNQSQLSDAEDGRAWWEVAEGSPDKISQAMDIMYDLYEGNPLAKADNPYERTPEDSSRNKLERTRRRLENGNGVDSRSPSLLESPSNAIHVISGSQTPDHSRTVEHINGNGVTKEDVDLTPKAKAQSEQGVHQSQTDGASDEKLKEAANDPATHETTAPDSVVASHTNGYTDTENITSPLRSTPKRKVEEMTDKTETNGTSKRPRYENGTKSDDEEEEGELEG